MVPVSPTLLLALISTRSPARAPMVTIAERGPPPTFASTRAGRFTLDPLARTSSAAFSPAHENATRHGPGGSESPALDTLFGWSPTIFGYHVPSPCIVTP